MQNQWDGDESRIFSVFVAISGYPGLTLIQNIGRFDVWNILLRSTSFAISSIWSSSSKDKINSSALFTNGRGSVPSKFAGILCLVNKAQTLYWDSRLWSSWENEGPGSVASRILPSVWNMANTHIFTRRPHIFSMDLNAATLSAKIKTVFVLPWRNRVNLLSRLNMSHKLVTFATHSVLMKCSAMMIVLFSKWNLRNPSHNSKVLASDLSLERYIWVYSYSDVTWVNRVMKPTIIQAWQHTVGAYSNKNNQFNFTHMCLSKYLNKCICGVGQQQ